MYKKVGVARFSSQGSKASQSSTASTTPEDAGDVVISKQTVILSGTLKGSQKKKKICTLL